MSYANRNIVVEPRKHGEMFGLKYKNYGRNHYIIKGITKNSPAEKSKFKINDIISFDDLFQIHEVKDYRFEVKVRRHLPPPPPQLPLIEVMITVAYCNHNERFGIDDFIPTNSSCYTLHGINKDTPAERSGFREGDIISHKDILRIAKKEYGSKVKVTRVRPLPDRGIPNCPPPPRTPPYRPDANSRKNRIVQAIMEYQKKIFEEAKSTRCQFEYDKECNKYEQICYITDKVTIPENIKELWLMRT